MSDASSMSLGVDSRPELTIDLQRSLASSDDEYAYLGEHSGVLRDVETDELAGRMRVFVIDLEGAASFGWSASELLDLEDATEIYMTLLGEEEGNFSPAVLRILGEEFAFNRNMLVIDRIELLPIYRGRGLGITCMNACLNHLSLGCRIATLKAYPLQFEGHARDSEDWNSGLHLSSLPKNQREATRRLRRHYGQLGFQTVPRTELMIRDLYADRG